MSSRRHEPLRIGGLTALTTIDYPGELAAVVFCQGCPWRCRYCQNGTLLPGHAEHPISWDQVRSLLERRRGLLDAVVFSGGEPTLQRGLATAMREAKDMGFKIGLHTAGSYPRRLAQLLPLLDWVGLDIKAPAEDYQRITGVPGSAAAAYASLEVLLQAGGPPFQVRTTDHPELLDRGQIRRLGRELRGLGVESHVLQPCIAEHCLDPTLRVPRAAPDRVLEA